MSLVALVLAAGVAFAFGYVLGAMTIVSLRWNVGEATAATTDRRVCGECGSPGTVNVIFPNEHHSLDADPREVNPDLEDNEMWVCKDCDPRDGPRWSDRRGEFRGPDNQ